MSSGIILPRYSDDPSLPRMRDQYVDLIRSTPPIGENAITQFLVVANPTGGVNVSFGLTNTTGIGSLVLVRAGSNDIKQATVLQSWTSSVSNFEWSDTGATLNALGQAYYWIKLEPANVTGSEIIVGPQFILLNPSLVAPPAATDISASHAAAANGAVLVTCNVAGVNQGEGIQITVTGYLGNPSPVAIATAANSPLQFSVEATGETVTLTALALSSGGTPASSGPTTTLTLNASATAPAKVEGVTVAQISTGNQITWPASLEVGITGYQVWRGQRGTAFLGASLLATVAATGVGTVEYLDTAGLTGDFQYFIIAVSSSGNSSPSNPANPAVLFSSVPIPTNVPTNTTNTATVDSIDAGSSALIRIYGPGGVGTSYTRITGFGTVTRPNGTISGTAYSTKYYVMYTGSAYVAETTFPAILPDGWEWVGQLTTTAAGGTSGSGATATAVINGSGQVIQINPVTNGSGYFSATANIAGGGGSGAAATANVVGGQVTSYTVTNGGSLYTTAPTVTVTPGGAGGTTGGGGVNGSPAGCVELGTEVIAPEGTIEVHEPCSEWVALDLGDGPLVMHPETLVAVWKRAKDVHIFDRVEVEGANWKFPKSKVLLFREGTKVKRTCPGGTYLAGPSRIRLHNVKVFTT